MARVLYSARHASARYRQVKSARLPVTVREATVAGGGATRRGERYLSAVLDAALRRAAGPGADFERPPAAAAVARAASRWFAKNFQLRPGTIGSVQETARLHRLHRRSRSCAPRSTSWSAAPAAAGQGPTQTGGRRPTGPRARDRPELAAVVAVGRASVERPPRPAPASRSPSRPGCRARPRPGRAAASAARSARACRPDSFQQ